jgi:Fur family ferric uptake transcriptional regulator
MERQTRQRQAVLEALSGSGRTLSPPEILSLAQVQAPGLNLSTVYRQIRSLEEAGEVLKVQLPGQAARFELPCRHGHGAAAHAAEAPLAAPAAAPAEAQPHHHHHFHCRVCDEVVPIHGCPGPMHELAPPGCLVEHHDLVLHGRCARCAGSAA